MSAEYDAIEPAVLACVVAATGLQAGDPAPAPGDELLASGLLDSLGVMELVAALEERFGFAVDDTDIIPDHFRSVADISRLVEERTTGHAWRSVLEAFATLVSTAVPPGATVLVVSRGDEDLLVAGEASARHFPDDGTGAYTGFHPIDGDDAIERLDAAIAAGATHLALPESELWWLDHYAELRERLASRHRELARGKAGVVFGLCHNGQ